MIEAEAGMASGYLVSVGGSRNVVPRRSHRDTSGVASKRTKIDPVASAMEEVVAMETKEGVPPDQRNEVHTSQLNETEQTNIRYSEGSYSSTNQKDLQVWD